MLALLQRAYTGMVITMVKKQEIMAKVAVRAVDPAVTPEVAATVVEKFFETLAEYLKAGESYNVPRFATFKPVQRAARVGRNPLTRERIAIAPQKSVKLVLSDIMKEYLNVEKPYLEWPPKDRQPQ